MKFKAVIFFRLCENCQLNCLLYRQKSAATGRYNISNKPYLLVVQEAQRVSHPVENNVIKNVYGMTLHTFSYKHAVQRKDEFDIHFDNTILRFFTFFGVATFHEDPFRGSQPHTCIAKLSTHCNNNNNNNFISRG